jgi:long-chain acyl-CoA synthetase
MEEAFLWDVVDKYNLKVSPHKKISNFSLINEELPRTRLSKLKRFMLPELVSNKNKMRESTPEPELEEYSIVKKFLTGLKETEVFPGDHLEIDLGLDSLDRVTFQVFLNETFGINVGDEDFVNFPTVEKLSEHISIIKTKTNLEKIDWGKILNEKIHLNLPQSWVTHNIFKNISRLFLKTYFRLKVAGHKNIPDGPVIIAPNHQSFFDGLFVASFLKNNQMKKTYFYAKEKHVRNKIVKFIADRHNVIVMDINKDLKTSLQKLASVLEKGKNIIIFPEGTRTKTGELGKFKKTFAILSSELKVPVVPVAISGAFDALPKGSRWPKPFKEIKVKFLDPVTPGDHTYESLSDLVYQKVYSELQ